MSLIVSIAGSSGVGKTTLSNLFLIALADRSVANLSGDNYHKWDRFDERWRRYTHLNPEANNLSEALQHLIKLKDGVDVKVPFYNHDTGLFEEGTQVKPADFIVYEGLHSLYGNASKVADIKIFVDTDEDLKIEWKLNRDTQDRGYTREQVLGAIRRRKIDDEKYIHLKKDLLILSLDLKRKSAALLS